MFLNVLAILLFLLPGAAAELHYLMLEGRINEENRIISIVRGMCFSTVILLFRCLLSYCRGYGALLTQDLFFSIGNVTKYILLSAILVLLLPNAWLLLNQIYRKIVGR